MKKMRDINKKTKYEGQALAITMVVLVVSALIGLSIYSRATKDKILTMEERMSAEALEVSDAMLERLVIFSSDEVLSEMSAIAGEGANVEEGITLTESEYEGDSQITDLFRNLGVIEGTSQIEQLLSPLCPLTDTGANEYKLTLEKGEDYEIRAGHVWGLPMRDLLEGLGPDVACPLELDFDIRGDRGAGFVITKIYCDYDSVAGIASNCDEYREEDITSYCFSSVDSPTVCNNADRFYDTTGGSNWEKYVPGVTDITPIELNQGTPPSEVRVTSVAGTISIEYHLPEECMTGLDMYRLKATANCSGVYRGKEILIPESKWSESLFDYLIFNNEGSL